MSAETTAGTSISICAYAPATHDPEGYGDLTWTEIGEVTDLGNFGRVFALVTHKAIKTRGTKKIKGSFDEGKIALQYGFDDDDSGQLIMEAAVGDDDPYSIRIISQSGMIFYMRVLVMSAPAVFGGSDTVVSVNADMEITVSDDGVGVVVVRGEGEDPDPDPDPEPEDAGTLDFSLSENGGLVALLEDI